MVYSNYPLTQLNTFGVAVSAAYFAQPATIEEIMELLSDNRYGSVPRLVLGGGSNVLFLDNFQGLVIRPQIKGIEKIDETDETVYLRVGAGVIWDDFVAYAVENNLGGIENLSWIPGHVGASPIQNIGAYGIEAKEVIYEVTGVTGTGEMRSFSNEECEFGYRDSIFKRGWKNKLLVTHVVFCLTKNPVMCIHYGNLEEELANYPAVTLQTVRQSVIAIRQNKLPDPAELGNAGSFFKNPVVPRSQAERIIAADPQMTAYPVDNQLVKLPAGRLIEQAGWKGKKIGNTGVHACQALVLVNYGGATGRDILCLAEEIRQSVYEKFGVRLEMEVNVI